MKTIAIFSGYALPHLGGVERYTENLKNELINNGCKVIIVSSNYDRTTEYKIKDNDTTYYKVPVYKIFSSRYPIVKHNKEYRKIIKDLETEKIDRIIVNTRFYLTSLMGAKFGKKHNIEVSLIEHGSSHLSVNNVVLDFFGKIYEHILTHFVKKYVDKYYGVSSDATNWQKHFGITSDGIWYNSVYRFDKGMKIEKSKKEIIFLYAGRVLKQKGVEDAIIAFNKLSKGYKNIKLWIAGDGDQLQYLVDKYGKNKKITFYGKLDFEKVKELYSKANVFLHPSKYPEGLPTSIIEAGLLECAIIASPRGGTRTFINNDNGRIIENNEELYKSMKELIDNPNMIIKMGKNMKQTVIDNFIWDKNCKKILKDLKIKSD